MLLERVGLLEVQIGALAILHRRKHVIAGKIQAVDVEVVALFDKLALVERRKAIRRCTGCVVIAVITTAREHGLAVVVAIEEPALGIEAVALEPVHGVFHGFDVRAFGEDVVAALGPIHKSGPNDIEEAVFFPFGDWTGHDLTEEDSHGILRADVGIAQRKVGLPAGGLNPSGLREVRSVFAAIAEPEQVVDVLIGGAHEAALILHGECDSAAFVE